MAGDHYGLFFDVDGVIADSESVNVRATIATYRELFDLEVTQGDFEAGLGRGAAAYVRAGAEANNKELTESELEAAVALRFDKFMEIL